MNVQSSTCCRALLDIYATHHKGRNGSLSLRQLERDWKETGLRRSDLDIAIAAATRRRWLLLHRIHDGDSYELSYLGECAMHLPLVGGPIHSLRDWLTLLRARLRRHARADATAPHDRRAGDRPAARIRGDAPSAGISKWRKSG